MGESCELLLERGDFFTLALFILFTAAEAGLAPADYVVDQLKSGELAFAVEDPEHEDNHPRLLSLWRSNLLGSSAKGNEYFLRHLLGTDSAATAQEAPPEQRPRDVAWPDRAAEGKLDLLLTLDFRMTSSTILSDIVLPAATWYEKHDLNTTDMHPFIHSFNPAIAPPWQTKTDWETWKVIARRFSELAADHLGTRTDVVAKPPKSLTTSATHACGSRMRPGGGSRTRPTDDAPTAGQALTCTSAGRRESRWRLGRDQ
mgnify:CR=1 FL=1